LVNLKCSYCVYKFKCSEPWLVNPKCSYSVYKFKCSEPWLVNLKSSYCVYKFKCSEPWLVNLKCSYCVYKETWAFNENHRYYAVIEKTLSEKITNILLLLTNWLQRNLSLIYTYKWISDFGDIYHGTYKWISNSNFDRISWIKLVSVADNVRGEI